MFLGDKLSRMLQTVLSLERHFLAMSWYIAFMAETHVRFGALTSAASAKPIYLIDPKQAACHTPVKWSSSLTAAQ